MKSLELKGLGGFFIILECDSKFAVICDGKRRTLEKTKKKNLIHLAVTNTVADEASMQTNRGIRKFLSAFNADDKEQAL